MKSLICDQSDLVSQWVVARTGGTWIPETFSAIGLAEDGVIVAGTCYEQFNGRSVVMSVALEQPLTPRFLFASFDYPFNQLGATKVIGLVDSQNLAAVRLDRHLGFELEATLKEAGPRGDLLIFTMTRDQCKWLSLGKRYGQQGRRQAT